jgi:hypothetical protein
MGKRTVPQGSNLFRRISTAWAAAVAAVSSCISLFSRRYLGESSRRQRRSRASIKIFLGHLWNELGNNSSLCLDRKRLYIESHIFKFHGLAKLTLDSLPNFMQFNIYNSCLIPARHHVYIKAWAPSYLDVLVAQVLITSALRDDHDIYYLTAIFWVPAIVR